MPLETRDNLGERTREPTALRLKEARQRGQVARSADLTAAAVMLGGLVGLALLAPGLLGELTGMTAALLDGGPAPARWSADALAGLATRAAGTAAWTVGGLVIASMGIAALVGMAQTGGVAAGERIRPDWGRISPSAGLGRLFSARTLVRAAMAGAKIAAISAVAYWTIRPVLPRLAEASLLDVGAIAAEAGRLAAAMGARIVLVLGVLAGADWMYQRWQHRRDLRMTRREWNDDVRRMEGDPRMRHRRRRIAEQLGDRQIGEEVRSAAVVVHAPHGPAVALQYDETMKAPRIVTRGTEFTALRILRAAAEAGVPVVVDAQAARAVYRSCQAGRQIPPALYDTAARLLARTRSGPGPSRVSHG